MEKNPSFSHYCDDEKNKLFTAFSLKNKTAREYYIPYETIFLFDSAQINNQIYFTGGGLPESSKQEEQTFFNIAMRVTILINLESTTEKLANMLDARAMHTLVQLANKEIYAIGGCNETGDLSLCEAYDVAKNKWRKCPNLTEKKIWVSVCPFNDRYLYAFGGGSYQDNEKTSKAIEFYDTHDLLAKQWTKVTLVSGAELAKACIFSGIMQIAPENILIFGGHVDGDASDTSFVFKPATKTLEKWAKLAKGDEFYRTKPQILGDELMIVGSMGDLHTFNRKSNKWTMTHKNTWNPDLELRLKADTR